MKAQINAVGIITQDLTKMRDFYRDVIGMEILLEMEQYVEFKHEGVRFALSTNEVMIQATSHESYKVPHQGQSIELMFKVDTKDEVDNSYKEVVEKGASPITPPADMPWGQRTAFFADPDGHIHEIFADL